MNTENYSYAKYDMVAIWKIYQGLIDNAVGDRKKNLISLGVEGFIHKWFERIGEDEYIQNDAANELGRKFLEAIAKNPLLCATQNE